MKVFTFLLVFSWTFGAIAHEGGGLVGAARIQRAIITGCILKSEQDFSVNRNELPESYSDSDWKYLYVLGLKIFAVQVELTLDGETGVFPCDKNFPYLSWVHFYKGSEADTLVNLQKEVLRLRPELNQHFGK